MSQFADIQRSLETLSSNSSYVFILNSGAILKKYLMLNLIIRTYILTVEQGLESATDSVKSLQRSHEISARDLALQWESFREAKLQQDRKLEQWKKQAEKDQSTKSAGGSQRG